MRQGFAKWEIQNSVFSKGQPQAGNCWHPVTLAPGATLTPAMWPGPGGPPPPPRGRGPGPGGPAPGRAPPLTTPAAVAEWLDLEPERLDWFADVQGRQRRTPPGPLRHYDYRWVAKRGGSARLIEAPR